MNLMLSLLVACLIAFIPMGVKANDSIDHSKFVTFLQDQIKENQNASDTITYVENGKTVIKAKSQLLREVLSIYKKDLKYSEKSNSSDNPLSPEDFLRQNAVLKIFNWDMEKLKIIIDNDPSIEKGEVETSKLSNCHNYEPESLIECSEGFYKYIGSTTPKAIIEFQRNNIKSLDVPNHSERGGGGNNSSTTTK